MLLVDTRKALRVVYGDLCGSWCCVGLSTSGVRRVPSLAALEFGLHD